MKTSNFLVSKCNYDIVSILDVDDKWEPTKLENQISFFPEYDVVGTLCQYFGDNNGCPKLPTGKVNNDTFKKFNPMINSSVLLRKELCLWIDEKLDDYDLWIRLALQNKKFYNVDKKLTLHRIHKKSYFNNDNNDHVKLLLNKYYN